MTTFTQKQLEQHKRMSVSQNILSGFRYTMEKAQTYMSELEKNYNRDLDDLVATRKELETLKKRNAESLVEKELLTAKEKINEYKELLEIERNNTKYLEEELRKYKPQDEYTDDEDMDNEDNKLTEEEKVELPKLMEKFYNMMDAKGVYNPYNEIPSDYCLKVKHLFAITHRNPNMRKSYDVLEPQSYTKVTELNYNHDMLGREIGYENDDEFEIGLFYTTDGLDRENIPGSGSGYDIWYLANRGLYDFFMTKLNPLPPSHDDDSDDEDDEFNV